MKKKFTIAVLEDDSTFLKEIVTILKQFEYFEQPFYASKSDEFIRLVRERSPDLLLLDIQLKDDDLTGINVAQLFNIPVLFLSGERRDHLESLDNLNVTKDMPMQHIGKNLNQEYLNKIFTKFLPSVTEFQRRLSVEIKPKGGDPISINTKDVVIIRSIKGKGNHKFCFTNRKPIEVVDKSFDHFRANGFDEKRFYLFGKSELLNISLTTLHEKALNISYIDEFGVKQKESLPVPTDKLKEVRKIFV